MEPGPAVPGFGPPPPAIGHPAQQNENEIPRAMTQSDVDETISSFVRATVSARSLGVDGVEHHGAHGYLIDQFFWPVTNCRGDK